MAKKKFELSVDFTWSGEENTETFLGKQFTISSAEECWSETEALWTDETISIIKELLYGGSRGGVRKDKELWNAWDKLTTKNKQKIVKVIVYLKTGIKLESKIDVNKYKLTIEDVNILKEGYKLVVDDVNVREETKLVVDDVKIT